MKTDYLKYGLVVVVMIGIGMSCYEALKTLRSTKLVVQRTPQTDNR